MRSKFKALIVQQPTALTNRQLKRIYSSSLRLNVNVERAQIREMIRRGFFSKGVWLDELDVLESVAREIVNGRDEKGRTMMETDRLLWMRAKEIIDLAAKVPSEERHPGPKLADQHDHPRTFRRLRR
jgi:hypothetical protein